MLEECEIEGLFGGMERGYKQGGLPPEVYPAFHGVLGEPPDRLRSNFRQRRMSDAETDSRAVSP